MAEARRFTVREAARLARVPARSVNFWSGPAKVFVPEVAYGGRGSRKLFSERDLVRLRVAYLLTQRWIPLRTVRAAIRQGAIEEWFDPCTTTFGPAEVLVCRGSGDWARHSGGVHPETGIPTALLADLWRKDIGPHEDVIVINLGAVKADIRKRL